MYLTSQMKTADLSWLQWAPSAAFVNGVETVPVQGGPGDDSDDDCVAGEAVATDILPAGHAHLSGRC